MRNAFHSHAFAQICDRFILLAGLLDLLTRQKLFDDTWVQGDGDFYDSLCHVKNVLRKEIWVVGEVALNAFPYL